LGPRRAELHFNRRGKMFLQERVEKGRGTNLHKRRLGTLGGWRRKGLKSEGGIRLEKKMHGKCGQLAC